MRTIAVTGGLGFIGSNFVRYWIKKYPDDKIVVMDAGTYAARPGYLKDVNDLFVMEWIDIRDQAALGKVFAKHRPDHIFHFAAESHVCRSISGPRDFVTTNIVGTFNLLEEFRALHKPDPACWPNRFIHVSTDEVFGQLGYGEPRFNEGSDIKPRSPYAASKAASDLLALSYHSTYGMSVTVTNCSNNYGPNQHEEKLIPSVIRSLMRGEAIQVYQDGKQVRDWIHVDDHCRALDVIFHKGWPGNRYCIGGDKERTNLQTIDEVSNSLSWVLGKSVAAQLMYTNSRPTDDRRYAVDSFKLKSIGWGPSIEHDLLLNKTVRWYLDNMEWGAEAHRGVSSMGSGAHV